MATQIKCSKCNLTYDSSNKECPYCHKKRAPSFGKIFIFIIIFGLAGYGGYSLTQDVISMVADSDEEVIDVMAETEQTTKTETTASKEAKETEAAADESVTTTILQAEAGTLPPETEAPIKEEYFKYSILSVDRKASELIENTEEVTISLDVENISDAERIDRFNLQAYADGYQIEFLSTLLFPSTGKEVMINKELLPETKETGSVIVLPNTGWQEITLFYKAADSQEYIKFAEVTNPDIQADSEE